MISNIYLLKINELQKTILLLISYLLLIRCYKLQKMTLRKAVIKLKFGV